MLQSQNVTNEDQFSLQKNYSLDSIIVHWGWSVFKFIRQWHAECRLSKAGFITPSSKLFSFSFLLFSFLLSHEKSSKLNIKTKANRKREGEGERTLRGSCYVVASERKTHLWLIWRRLQIALGNDLSPNSPPSIHLLSSQPKENKLNSPLPGPTCGAARLSRAEPTNIPVQLYTCVIAVNTGQPAGCKPRSLSQPSRY